jgi:hypothetical protein
MRPSSVVVALLAAAALTLPTPGSAQGRPVELGTFDLSGGSAIAVSIPVQDFRAGFFLSDRLSLEPRLALSFFDSDGTSSQTALSSQVGALVHFHGDRTRAQPYIRPFGGVLFLDVGGNNDAQFLAGGGIGVKIPIADRLAARVEGVYTHGFESSGLGTTDAVSLLVGFSFFTR